MTSSTPPVFGSLPAGAAARERRAAYAMVARGDGRVAAVVARAGGREALWLPGGESLPGKTPEETVRREVREELGRDVRVTGGIGRAVQHFHSAADGCWYTMAAVFLRAELAAGPPGSGEHELRWVDAGREGGLFFHASHAWAARRATREDG